MEELCLIIECQLGLMFNTSSKLIYVFYFHIGSCSFDFSACECFISREKIKINFAGKRHWLSQWLVTIYRCLAHVGNICERDHQVPERNFPEKKVRVSSRFHHKGRTFWGTAVGKKDDTLKISVSSSHLRTPLIVTSAHHITCDSPLVRVGHLRRNYLRTWHLQFSKATDASPSKQNASLLQFSLS